MYFRLMAITFSVLNLAACSSHNNISYQTQTHQTSVVQTNDTTAPQKDESVIIGHLGKRDTIITIYAGQEGCLYTVKKKDGTVVAEKIDDKQLQAKHPDIYRDLKTGIAGSDASLMKDGD